MNRSYADNSIAAPPTTDRRASVSSGWVMAFQSTTPAHTASPAASTHWAISTPRTSNEGRQSATKQTIRNMRMLEAIANRNTVTSEWIPNRLVRCAPRLHPPMMATGAGAVQAMTRRPIPTDGRNGTVGFRNHDPIGYRDVRYPGQRARGTTLLHAVGTGPNQSGLDDQRPNLEPARWSVPPRHGPCFRSSAIACQAETIQCSTRYRQSQMQSRAPRNAPMPRAWMKIEKVSSDAVVTRAKSRSVRMSAMVQRNRCPAIGGLCHDTRVQ